MPEIRSEETLLPPTQARTLPLTPAEPAKPVDPAQWIGRYRVLDQLGKGGMGVVYSAYDPELDRKVALKLIYGEIDVERLHRSQELLRREAQALAKLAHPNIVAIHDVGVHGGQVFVAMEFVAGRTMRQWWEEHDPDWQDVLMAMVQAGRGLVAAHAVGLVHRDIKPDNLLIGDDERVRVADFGIARHGTSASEMVPLSPVSDHEMWTIGGRGTIVGTPAYMPPEQHDGGEVGPHSDQFSFCVTLWEGLYGQRPFVGEASTLPDLIRAGVPTRPAAVPELPAWLTQAVLRGISPRREDRWPSMQALLEVLTVDFAARRARRTRRVLYAALAVVGSVALVLGGRALQTIWARQAAERAAAERLVGITASVERMLARGMRDEAEETLRAFVQAPELRDTQAAIDAWLMWADHMDASDDRAAAQAAVVEAYTALPADDPGEPAIALRIAQQFRGSWKFDELAALGDQVVQRWPDEARSPAWAELRAEAALARGDLTGALAVIDSGAVGDKYDDTVPALRALATWGCPVVGEMAAWMTDWPGSGGPELVIHEREFVKDRPRRQSLRRLDPALTPVGPTLAGLPFWSANAHSLPLVRVAGGPAYMLAYTHIPAREAILIEIGAEGPRELLRWGDDGPNTAATADLDGDGVRELYVGTAAYTRKLYRLEPDAQGVWQRRAAHPPTDAMNSDINALAAGDFDGDGREELAVAVGAWRAYDVRIFEADADGALRVAARRRFGHVTRLVTLRGADGSTLMALAKDDTARSKEAWAPGEAQGEPAGIHIVRRSGDTIVPVAHFPWHEQAGWLNPQHTDRLMVADLDADGLQDVVASLESESPFATLMLLRQRPDGSFARVVLGGRYPLLAGNFDDDPADEVLVSTQRGDGVPALCLLGVAGEPVTVSPAPHHTAEAPALSDPLLARAWARTENLAAFGLSGEAARTLARRAAGTANEADRRALRRRAAELYEAAGEWVRAGEHYEALADEGDVDAAVRAVASFEQGLRMADALRVARRALASPALTPAQASELRAAHERLAAIENRDARVELRFDGVLDPAWQIDQPLALRVDPVRGELVVDATADMRTLASLPIELTGEPLTLEFDVDIERAEWGTQLAVTVQSPDGQEMVVELVVSSGGGGGYLQRSDIFGPFWVFGAWETASPAERSRHRIRATVLPAHDRVHAEEQGDHPAERRVTLERPIRPGPHTLVLRSTGNPDFATQQIRGRIRRIALLGARPVASVPAGARARVARALVDGDWPTALSIRGDSAELRLWRGAALAELGRGAEATAAFASLDPTDPVIRRQLCQLLRTRPAIFAPALRAATGPSFAALLLAALQKKGEYADDELAALRLAATADLEGLPDAGDMAAQATRAGLFALRGALWKSAGKLARAEADLAVAAALTERASTEVDARDPGLATIELRRAEVAAQAGRVDDAVAAASRALRRATDPDWMIERLRNSPALRPLQADPRWQALFVGHL